jgi:hypothetical protein
MPGDLLSCWCRLTNRTEEDIMIAEKTEKPMRVGQAAAMVRSTKGDGTIHPTTVLKWIRRGVHLPDGTTLRLRATKRPGGWMVAGEDLDEFLDRYAAAALDEAVPASGRVAVASGRRRRELDLVDRRLEARGLGMDPSEDGRAG